MTILKKLDNASEWKENYLHLLDEQKEREINIQNKIDLLCLTIVRLSIVAKGVSKSLDPHLDQFKRLLKKGLNEQKLKEELDNFSDTLLQLDESCFKESRTETTLLFGFLLQYALSTAEQHALVELQEAFDNGQIASSQELFSSILDIIKPTKKSAVSLIDAESPSSLQIETNFISSQLLQIFDSIETPPDFENQLKKIKSSLQAKHSAKTFKPIFQSAVELLLNIKQSALREKREIKKFLEHLANQLTELSQQAVDANDLVSESSSKQQQFDQSVTEQMLELQQNSVVATKLEPLKQLVNAKLDKIAKQFQEHRQIENRRLLENEKKLGELSYKINQLESEAGSLKLNFMLAHDKALRDPLTGLPNRIAYEERLNDELARWKRYQSPLSLLIWDIDHFKRINDEFGHKAGDKAFVIISRLFSKQCRQTDFVCRFGEGKFVMLLPNTNKTNALNLAFKLCRLIERTGFNSKGTALDITVSCGIAQFVNEDSKETVFERAGQGLFKAKKNGRNQCVVN